MKTVAVLYPGGGAADNPEVPGRAENATGLREDVMVSDGEIQSGSYRAIYG